jgi:hypothetical protein
MAKSIDDLNAAVDDLIATVAAEDTVIDSAIAFIAGVPALIEAAGTDATKLSALSTAIKAKAQQLADAMVANTPEAPPA